MPSCSLMNILYIFMKSSPMWLDELNENTSLNFFFFSFVMKIKKKKQYHRKVLLTSFRLNGHTLRFRPQFQKLETLEFINLKFRQRVSSLF